MPSWRSGRVRPRPALRAARQLTAGSSNVYRHAGGAARRSSVETAVGAERGRSGTTGLAAPPQGLRARGRAGNGWAITMLFWPSRDRSRAWDSFAGPDRQDGLLRDRPACRAGCTGPRGVGPASVPPPRRRAAPRLRGRAARSGRRSTPSWPQDPACCTTPGAGRDDGRAGRLVRWQPGGRHASARQRWRPGRAPRRAGRHRRQPGPCAGRSTRAVRGPGAAPLPSALVDA
jgi:hypothetical protein